MRPVNIGNAYVVQDTHLPILKLVLLRYEAFFNRYSEEPYNINIRIHKNNKLQSFEQVLRVRKWIPNTCAYALYIYSADREWSENNLIIRRVFWDIKRDINALKNSNENERDELLISWPNIKSESAFLDKKDSSELTKSLLHFDAVINNGILLEDRPNLEKCLFSDIELMRRFSWGEIRGIWNTEKYNQNIEKQIDLLEVALTSYLENNNTTIYQMSFDYISSIDDMKKDIFGE